MNTDASGRNVTFRIIFFHNVNVGSGSVDLDPAGNDTPDPQPHYEYWGMRCEFLAVMSLLGLHAVATLVTEHSSVRREI